MITYRIKLVNEFQTTRFVRFLSLFGIKAGHFRAWSVKL